MFDIGWTELVVVGVIALIVIGPRDLPRVLRSLGQVMTKVRRMASEFQSQFQDAMREAELDELRKQAEKLSGDFTSASSFNPIDKVTSELQAAIDAPDRPSSPSSSASAAPESPAAADADQQAAAAAAPSESTDAPASADERPAGEGGRAA